METCRFVSCILVMIYLILAFNYIIRKKDSYLLQIIRVLIAIGIFVSNLFAIAFAIIFGKSFILLIFSTLIWSTIAFMSTFFIGCKYGHSIIHFTSENETY